MRRWEVLKPHEIVTEPEAPTGSVFSFEVDVSWRIRCGYPDTEFVLHVVEDFTSEVASGSWARYVARHEYPSPLRGFPRIATRPHIYRVFALQTWLRAAEEAAGKRPKSVQELRADMLILSALTLSDSPLPSNRFLLINRVAEWLPHTTQEADIVKERLLRWVETARLNEYLSRMLVTLSAGGL